MSQWSNWNFPGSVFALQRMSGRWDPDDDDEWILMRERVNKDIWWVWFGVTWGFSLSHLFLFLSSLLPPHKLELRRHFWWIKFFLTFNGQIFEKLKANKIVWDVRFALLVCLLAEQGVWCVHKVKVTERCWGSVLNYEGYANIPLSKQVVLSLPLTLNVLKILERAIYLMDHRAIISYFPVAKRRNVSFSPLILNIRRSMKMQKERRKEGRKEESFIYFPTRALIKWD